MRSVIRSAAGRGATDRGGPGLGRAGTEGYRPGEPGYRRIAVALFAAGVATFALLYSTQALLPELVRAFSISAADATLSLSLTTAGLGLALLFTGSVSEVLGRTRLIHTSLLAAALIGLACAVAPAGTRCWRCGWCKGSRWPACAVATAYLREEMHPGGYARTAGLYVGGTALGGMSGRLLTGAVADAAGWRGRWPPWPGWAWSAPCWCWPCCRPRGTSCPPGPGRGSWSR